VAARIGDRAITVKELDDQWRKGDPADQADTIQKLYDGRRNALEEIVSDMLLAEAGKAKGLSPEAYLQSEIAKRATPVTDAEVANFYQNNLDQMQGRSLEVMAPTITRYLIDLQADASRLALIKELRKGGPAVRLMMDVPRFEVTLSDADPSIGKSQGTGHACRVLRLSVPVLPTGRPDAEEDSRDLRRQGSDRLEGLSTDADSPAGIQGRRGRALRGGAG
jgi:hypothetical protein